MSSAFDHLSLPQILQAATDLQVQGIDLCVFRKDGLRKDHVATHLPYEQFGLETAKQTIDLFNERGLRLSVGAFENLIGGDPVHRRRNQNHLLELIRIAYLLGGDQNDVTVGTFVGYNHELGNQDGGFEKNLEEYQKVFTPIIKYAELMGVTVVYENCPMEGWQPATYPTTYHNLPATLAARKLMYELIPSKAHGEIYDPSHDVWQHTDPVAVIEAMDMTRLKRIHVKATRRLNNTARTHWGGMYPMQYVDPTLAESAGVPIPASSWDRHHYEAMLPGFGGTDSMDWRAFVETLMRKGFDGPFEIENEAANSKATGNQQAVMQGCKATILFLAPMLWPLSENGFIYPHSQHKPLRHLVMKDVPIVTMEDLLA
jgi:sugar phosphate isomerase/epimerase